MSELLRARRALRIVTFPSTEVSRRRDLRNIHHRFITGPTFHFITSIQVEHELTQHQSRALEYNQPLVTSNTVSALVYPQHTIETQSLIDSYHYPFLCL